MMDILQFYDVPRIEKKNFAYWTRQLEYVRRRQINKLRNSYSLLNKQTSIIPVEIILPKSIGGLYWTDYVWDFANTLYPNMYKDNKSYIMITYRLDENYNVNPQIYIYHLFKNDGDGEKTFEFFDKRFQDKINWSHKKDAIMLLEI